MRRIAPLMMLVVLLAACASMRKTSVTSGAESSYRISVHNSRSSTIDVSYSNGTVTRELGSVGAGKTEQFVVIAPPSNPQITVLARTSSGTSLASKSVNLASQTSVTIN